MHYTHYDSPVGTLLIAADACGLRAIEFPRRGRRVEAEPGWRADGAVLRPAIAQLDDYFAGRRTRFELDLAPRGTSFQLRVWEELARIPYGQTISYGELARRIGRPRAFRAVGAANGRNPLPIVVPCHRVIASDGGLGGFGGGLPAKRVLLAIESGAVAVG